MSRKRTKAARTPSPIQLKMEARLAGHKGVETVKDMLSLGDPDKTDLIVTADAMPASAIGPMRFKATPAAQDSYLASVVARDPRTRGIAGDPRATPALASGVLMMFSSVGLTGL